MDVRITSKGGPTAFRTTWMMNILLDYTSEIFPIDRSIQYLKRISRRAQQGETITFLKKAMLVIPFVQVLVYSAVGRQTFSTAENTVDD